ncbi:tyrosine-protein phosphatase non-receptor type 20 isoform X2 [Hoplias malabaricus]|uniref:tyrosine-protein phosphatase non-receptor type 20 isoform X2 n=1 Tax=Hoplias malabaricus TaxID=27720 RepID=UPI0034631064
MESEQQDSRNATPTCQRCCPSLGVKDMLQGRTDLQMQCLENTTMNMEQSNSDGWSSDEDDEDEHDASLPSPLETLPHTDRPIVSEEELADLALISPPKNSQYSGASLQALIQMLQNQLDQQELVKEFTALEHLKPSDNCLVGKSPENREKNRYRDILPYDETRVPVGEKQDYINASYIRMKVGTEEFFYISSQGPLPSTQDCFWQMVWENKSDVIAMITQEVERGRVKCHKYWPEKLDVPMETSRYQLILDNYQMQDYFHIKVIKMVEKETGATHILKHLKFTTWPDHGTPQSSKQLVRFIRFMRAVHSEGPITVHCSAGIGRAGVLICIDVILSLIEKDLPINVSEIVREMRLQRYGMIQTKEQYLFCYKVWLEVLQSILLLHGNQLQSETPS